jgi:aryl-alcohol dehydrogenase-like predicted oxidoreductase
MDTTKRRPLGDTGLLCAPLGFGGYRITESSDAHRAALAAYLDAGGNLIDTSANYGGGQSERLIGRVFEERSIDTAIVVTKAGYIQGQNKIVALQSGVPEIVHYAPDVWHCMHPQFLASQLTASLKRLGRDQVDLLLIHNPEYYFLDRQKRGVVAPEDQTEFYRRIRAAFAALEEAVEAGSIGAYGVSSNRFAHAPNDPTATSVARMLDVACELSPAHHFRMVQLPLNLYESDAALEPFCDGQTVLEFCRDRGLSVLVNRPLNAIVSDHLIRLSDAAPSEAPRESLPELIRDLRRHEEEFARSFDFPLMQGGAGLAGWLGPALVDLDSADAFRAAIHQAVVPAVNTWLLNADKALGTSDRYRHWKMHFTDRLDRLLRAVEASLHQGRIDSAWAIRERLEQSGLSAPDVPLSRLALAVLLGLDGVTCVLNGMRTPEYVEDSLLALRLDVGDARAVLEAFRRLG